MEKQYREFLTNLKYVESKIIYELYKDGDYNTRKFLVNKDNDLNDFIKYYDGLSFFDQEVINVSIERIMIEAQIDGSYDLIELSGQSKTKEKVLYCDGSKEPEHGKKL